MFKLPFPCPHGAERAKILLEFIRYGIIIMKVKDCDDHAVFYVKSPERIHMKDESGHQIDARRKLIEFKRKIQEFESEAIILKRAPYKNDFDDWDEDYASQAYEEYKMFLMMCSYEEADLL